MKLLLVALVLLAALLTLESVRPDVYMNEAELEMDRVRVQNCLANAPYWKLEEPTQCKPKYE